MENQALVIALVGVLGIGAQWLAWRTGWPGIALMLAAGFLAGPMLGLFNPRTAFGDLLNPMVSIGVALILFEGGLGLDFRELRKYGQGVWRLVVFGVPLSWLFGSLACYYIAGLVWPIAILFGGVLVVTGPTVVIPLLRQATIQRRPAALLKWEAIVNDPLGALCAVVAYEYFRRSADGATLICGESFGKKLIAFDIAADGSLGNRRVWAELGEWGADGICMDAEGAVWVASGPRCLRVKEGGEVLERIEVGMFCFACMLGGADGRTLFINAAEWTGGLPTLGDAPTGRVYAARVAVPHAGRP